jgi:WD40 repeat protein
MLDGHGGAGISTLVFHPGGKRLASAAPPRPTPQQLGPGPAPTVVLWDLEGATPRWTYRDGKAGVSIDAMAYAGDHLVIGLSDGRLVRLDSATGRAAATVEVKADQTGFGSLDSTPGGSRVVSLGRRGLLQVRDAASLAVIREWEAGADVPSAAFLTDGLIVTGGRAIRLWDAASGRSLLTYDVADGPVRSLAVRPRSGQVVYTTQGSDVYRLDLTDLQRRLRDLSLAIPGLEL